MHTVLHVKKVMMPWPTCLSTAGHYQYPMGVLNVGIGQEFPLGIDRYGFFMADTDTDIY